jgi:hypothetical protein
MAALATVPIYYLGKLVYGPKVGLRAAVLFMCVPSVTLFLPGIDVLSPLFTAGSFYYFLTAFKRRNLWFFGISGTLLSVGAFFTLTILSVLLIYGIAGIHLAWKHRQSLQTLLRYTCAFTAGLLMIPILLYLTCGFDTIAAIHTILFNHLGFVAMRQQQSLWLLYNYYDFFMFVGIPLMILFLMQTKDALHALVNKRYAFDAMCVGFCLLTILLDFSGKMHGETGRTWTPFIPFILLPLVAYLHSRDAHGRAFLVIMVLQGIQLLTLSRYIVTVN